MLGFLNSAQDTRMVAPALVFCQVFIVLSRPNGEVPIAHMFLTIMAAYAATFETLPVVRKTMIPTGLEFPDLVLLALRSEHITGSTKLKARPIFFEQ